jgi:hypothetical protein
VALISLPDRRLGASAAVHGSSPHRVSEPSQQSHCIGEAVAGAPTAARVASKSKRNALASPNGGTEEEDSVKDESKTNVVDFRVGPISGLVRPLVDPEEATPWEQVRSRHVEPSDWLRFQRSMAEIFTAFGLEPPHTSLMGAAEPERTPAGERLTREQLVAFLGEMRLIPRSCETERLTGHYVGDAQIYRDKDELRKLREARGPIENLRKRVSLRDEEWAPLDAEAQRVADTSVEFAKAGTDPRPANALRHVYAEEH